MNVLASRRTANGSAATLTPRMRGLAVVVAGFTASRLLLLLAGVRFQAEHLFYFWQFLDPNLLRSRLLESVYYLHSQPPLFNLGLGIVLKFFPNHYYRAFQALYLVLGLVLAVSMYLLLERLDISRWWSVGLALFLSVTPATLLNENLLFYDYPLIACLAVAALSLHWFATRPSFARGLVFFSSLTALVLTRSVFHPLWFLLVLAILILVLRQARRRVLLSAALPLALISLVVLKNVLVFGVPATSSWLGMNLTSSTLGQISEGERRHLVEEGKISRYAQLPSTTTYIGAFRPLSAYRPLLKKRAPTGIPALDEELKPSGVPNFNNIAYIGISNQLLRDDLHVIAVDPEAYLHGVVKSLRLFFSPPDALEIVRTNREKIGTWERLFSTIVYAGTDGVVPLLVLSYVIALVYGFAKGMRAFRAPPETVASSVTVLFAATTLIVVTLPGVLAETGENFRFRFMTEPLILAVCALAALDAWRRFAGRLATRVGVDA